MNKEIVIGDLHLKPKEPYYSQVIDFIDWFLISPYNNPDHDLLLLGDLVETADASNELLAEFVDLFINKLKVRQIKILRGNHDEILKTSALSIFAPIPNVTIISEVTVEEKCGKKILYLPYYYHEKCDLPPKEEYYANLPEEYYQPYDYCFHHLEDHSEHFKDKFCDLSKLDVKQYVAGHIHTESITKGGHYLGSPILNSKSESGKTPIIMEIDYEAGTHKIIEVPKTLEFYDVEYPNCLPDITTSYAIFTVTESLDRQETINHYQKEAEKKGYSFYSRKIFKKKLKEQELFESEESDDKDHMEWFILYKEQAKLDPDVAKICEAVIQRQVS